VSARLARTLLLALPITTSVPVTSALAQRPTASPGRIEIPYKKFILPNGLTVIVHEDHKAPIVALMVWYLVCSKIERRGRTGLAHLCEHLMFNGSEYYE
jgi:zinc protease